MTAIILAVVGFLALGVPIAFALGLAAVVLQSLGGFPLLLVPLRMFNAPDNLILLAVPLFILAGNLMEAGGIDVRLVGFANSLTRWFRGGLGCANVMTGIFFAEISGVGVADAVVLTKMYVPEMTRRGYDRQFACGLTSVSAALGIIIPPSVPMLVYGAVTGVSVAALFAGGLIVGLLLALFFMVVTHIHARLVGLRAEARFSVGHAAQSFRHAFWSLGLPVVVLGGILGGVFTPTEAAVVAAIAALVLGAAVYRRLDGRHIPGILLSTGRQTGIVMLVVAATAPLAWYFSNQQVDEAIAAFLLSVSTNPTVIMLILAAVVLVLGMFLQAVPIIIALMPLLLPVLNQVHINPLHFGIVMVLLLSIGQQTPPVCSVLMAVCAVAKEPLWPVFVRMWPYTAAMLAMVLLVILFPALALFLPETLGMIR